MKLNHLENKCMSYKINENHWSGMEEETTWRLQESQMT